MNLATCEIYGQSVAALPCGRWGVSVPCEATEFPAFVVAFNHQLQADWGLRPSNRVAAAVDGTVPGLVVGRCGDVHWSAALETVRKENDLLIARYVLERTD